MEGTLDMRLMITITENWCKRIHIACRVIAVISYKENMVIAGFLQSCFEDNGARCCLAKCRDVFALIIIIKALLCSREVMLTEVFRYYIIFFLLLPWEKVEVFSSSLEKFLGFFF